MEIVLNEVDHTYLVDGKPFPGVTTIMQPISDFSMIPPPVLEKAQAEGTAIHRTVEYFEDGTLDEATLPEWLAPRLEAWKRFKADYGWRSRFSEKRVADPRLRYAGTLDNFGDMNDGPALIDVKRTTKRAAGVQTAAYLNALMAMKEISIKEASATRRLALNLNADGRYHLDRFTDPDDMRCFIGLLAVHTWKEKNPCWSR